MRYTEHFRTQHDAISMIASQIMSRLTKESGAEQHSQTLLMIGEMIGKLKSHLLFEDQFLYPALQKSKNPDLQKMAASFQEQMGGLAELVQEYWTKWNMPGAVAKDSSAFTTATKDLLTLLAKRIDRENNELYELADLNMKS